MNQEFEITRYLLLKRGAKKIKVQVARRPDNHPLTEQEYKQALEIIENIHRKPLTWYEEAEARAKLDELMRKLVGDAYKIRQSKAGKARHGQPVSDSDVGWSEEKTAKVFGLKSHSTISEDKRLVEAARRDPEVKAKKTRSEALQYLKEKEEKGESCKIIGLIYTTSACRLVSLVYI